MPTILEPRFRRAATTVAQVGAACLIVIVGGGGLLGSCAGSRPTLGSIAPRIPASTSTTLVSTTVVTPSQDIRLDPDSLLGWIATPVAAPEVYDSPSTTAKRLPIGPKTEAGAPTTFAIVGDGSPEATPEVSGWYRVALPTRPNGSTGWVPVASVKVTKTPFRIFVDLRGRTLRVEKDGSGVFTAEIAVGTADNPTPVNGTFVTELIQNNKPNGAYGPYAFGLALHSDTLTEFGGGDGQVGIHGTNEPQLIGQAVSHGCVRLKNSDVKDLVDLELPLGVPVFIS